MDKGSNVNVDLEALDARMQRLKGNDADSNDAPQPRKPLRILRNPNLATSEGNSTLAPGGSASADSSHGITMNYREFIIDSSANPKVQPGEHDSLFFLGKRVNSPR